MGSQPTTNEQAIVIFFSLQRTGIILVYNIASNINIYLTLKKSDYFNASYNLEAIYIIFLEIHYKFVHSQYVRTQPDKPTHAHLISMILFEKLGQYIWRMMKSSRVYRYRSMGTSLKSRTYQLPLKAYLP